MDALKGIAISMAASFLVPLVAGALSVPGVMEGPWGAWVTSRAFDERGGAFNPRIAVDAAGVPHVVAQVAATITDPLHANFLTRTADGWVVERIANQTFEGPVAFDREPSPREHSGP